MSFYTSNPINIALVGNPNCGKTALFNALTGSRQKVANYAGVTVERKEGLFTTENGKCVKVIDLPGTYSLRARSPDEKITRDVVLGRLENEQSLNFIICVADSTNLHLGLRLILELKKTGIPLILALNMFDIAQKRDCNINIKKLSQELEIPVVPTIAIKKTGIKALIEILNHKCSEQVSSLQTLSSWQELNSKEIREYHKEIERILILTTKHQGRTSVWTQRLDNILLHPFAGILVLFAVLFFMFQAVFTFAKIPQDLLQNIFDNLQVFLTHNLSNGMLKSLLIDGIISGVGSVVVFLPQIIILFFFILILEDSGYMVRATFIMDKIMGGVGLHGRAFIPLLSSFACAIPGIMATRTIDNRKDRFITILIAPLMTCSARIPVYTLIISAFIPAKNIFGFLSLQALVLFSLYALGIISALLVALFMKVFFLKGVKQTLLMELPSYKIPRLKNIIIGILERAKMFLTKAGTIILAMMIIIWFLCNFPNPPTHITSAAINYSFAGKIGHFLEPLVAPIGFNWQITMALIPGMAAREVAIASLGTIYAISSNKNELHAGLANVLAHQWTLPTALALLIWYSFAPQCISTLAVTKRETNSWKWPFIMFCYMMGLAYIASFITFHLSSLIIG